MTAADLTQSDTISRIAGATTAFDDYLQQAQTQDSPIGQSDLNDASFAQSSDAQAAAPAPGANSWADSDAPSDRSNLRPSDRIAGPDQSTSALHAPDSPKSRSGTTDQSADDSSSSSTTSKGQDRESSSSDNQTSSNDTTQSTKHEKPGTDKAKQDDSLAVVLDIGTNTPNVAAAGAAQAAGANASSVNGAATVAQQVAAATATVPGSVSLAAAKAGNAHAASSLSGRADKTSGNKSALTEKHNVASTGANADATPALTGDAASGAASGQAAASAAASAATVAATSANSASATTSKSATSASAASGANSTATASSATSGVSPGAIDPGAPGQTPVPAPAPPAEQAAAATTTTSTDATAGGATAAREQRAKAAVDALASTGSGDNGTTGPTQSGNANSTAPITASSSANNPTATSGTTAAHSAETNLSQADRVRFVQRVEQAFQDVNSQGGSVRLRLSPPDLGSLKIEIKVTRGEMTARVEADSPSARNLLLDNLPALRDRLAQHDIKVQRFDVDLMDRSGGGMANQSSQQQNPSWQDASPGAARAPARAAAAAPAVAEASPVRPTAAEGRLNVVV